MEQAARLIARPRADRDPAPRWTPARIRKALLCPKPQGQIAKAWRQEGGSWLTAQPVLAEEMTALRHICEHGDLITPPATPGEAWLLVPAPDWLIEILGSLDAAAEDIERDDEGEDDGTAEPDIDEDDNGDGAEPEPDDDDSAPEMWGEP